MIPWTPAALVALAVVPALTVACGGAPAAASRTASEDDDGAGDARAAPGSSAPGGGAANAPGDAPREDEALPTECAKRDDTLCTPPSPFVKRLCSAFHPDVALSMFSKGTPWTRGYLNRTVKAWNASGGAASNDELVFDEEVLVLAHRAADTGGMQLSGASGSYDVLRWDGTCASLMSEEMTLKPPPKAKHAKIPWKNLDLKVRDALAANETIGKVDAERRKECKGASMGEVSPKCVKADTRLSVEIVDYVRKGGAVPAPAKLP